MCDHCGCRDLAPVARLMSEHDQLRNLSGEIRDALAADDERDARAHVRDLLTVLAPHVLREERALFPRLRREVVLSEHVDVLESEHASLYDAVDALGLDAPAGASSSAPDPGWQSGVVALLDELAAHMEKEDYGLFPAALATLDGADWDVVDQWDGTSAYAAPVPA